MLLKLDFRDEFKLEDSPDCRFDFLEVRDGQYGYSNPLGNFCGTNFPPEITSKTRYLWLRFHSDENIEGKGFKAVWSTIPRPTYPGIPPEQEPCIFNVTGMQVIIHSDLVKDRKAQAEKEGYPLDCMWIIQVIQLVLDNFSLQHPNECEANFVEIFAEKTDLSSRAKQFCGSIADTIVVSKNIAHLRFYAEPKALNSTFEAVVTAVRDKESACRDDEYDCEDATCIAAELECNEKINCRFKWDEEEEKCKTKTARLIDSHHIVIILVVFSLIMFGMSFAFVFNCVRKLIRDHRIIQEHIRQSRENRLDELGRKSTPCPISVSTTDLHDHGSESPSLEVLPSKELMPPTTMIPQEYTKDLVLEMTYNASDIIDIHQSNNVSNATQERLQESSEEPEMRDNCCQTRESLFESRMSDAMVPYGFTTFGQQSISQCSGCSPASRGRDGSMGICPKHNPIPAPPGWSTHESSYPLSVPQAAQYPEQLDYPSYQKFQSPTPSREPSSVYRQSPKFIRQATLGSGERYGSSIYGSGHVSSNTTSSTSQHSSGNTPTKRQPQPTLDPRYRAEAVIEVDQRRPFSIESTKSAPDKLLTVSDSFCDRESSKIDQQSEISDISTHIHPTGERLVKELAGKSTKEKLEKSVSDCNGSGSNSIKVNAEPQFDDSVSTPRSINRTGWTTAGDSLISRPWREKAALKLHDLPILLPPEGFRVPVFRCRTPSLSWQHCGCLSHTHLPQRRSSIAWSAFERCNVDPMYRTWPNRATRRFGRPSRRTVGTQSSFDGARSSLGFLRCVVRSIDMTERSLDQEIGASIPF
ncbi:Neuropilin and tolloid-like protein 2 [Trachymyrmex zeteki]|uniref:Neuropilin and tolloid-like protein 2 n=1 Tax=Mycetomoellerius zeteki TaxID=64791 RepID=A0A151XCM2_9HYME|nr:Neuropilin and tolloid-like protein 2 [Trachymyrmex zeteki]